MRDEKEHIGNEIKIPEITLQFNWKESKLFQRVSSSRDVADMFRTFYKEGQIQFNESMFVLYLNNDWVVIKI